MLQQPPCLAQRLLYSSCCMRCCLNHHSVPARPAAPPTRASPLRRCWVTTQRLCDPLPAGAIPPDAAKAGQESLSTFGTFGPPITGATPSTVVGEDDLTQALGGQLETAEFTTRGFEPTPASTSPNFANTTTVAVGASHDVLASPTLEPGQRHCAVCVAAHRHPMAVELAAEAKCCLAVNLSPCRRQTRAGS